MATKKEIRQQFERNYTNSEIVFMDTNDRNFDNPDYKKFMKDSKDGKVKSTTINGIKIAYLWEKPTTKTGKSLVTYTIVSKIDESNMNNKLNKLQETIARLGEREFKVKDIQFDKLKRLSSIGFEGIIFLGAGGDLNEWINGINDILNSEEIGTGEIEDKFSGVYQTETTGGRTDLILIFKKESKLSMGKLAMWRLRFGDASWLSDYVVNYAKHHGQKSYLDDDDDFEGDPLQPGRPGHDYLYGESKRHTMNKLIETKLRRLVQKEIKSVLKEVDADTETNFNYFVEQLEAFLKENANSKYQPQIKFKGENAETKWLSVNEALIGQILQMILDKKYLFKRNK